MGNFYFSQSLVPNMHKYVQFILFCTPHVTLHEIKAKKYDLPVHQKSQVFQGTLKYMQLLVTLTVVATWRLSVTTHALLTAL